MPQTFEGQVAFANASLLTNAVIAVKGKKNPGYSVNREEGKIPSNYSLLSPVGNSRPSLIVVSGNQFTVFGNRVQGITASKFEHIRFSQGYFYQYLSSHTRFFGLGFKQDSNFVYIQKSDLPQLTVSQNNRAESLFVALLLKIMTDESNQLISRVMVEQWKTEFTTQQAVNNLKYLQVNTFLIHLRGSVIYKYSGHQYRFITNGNTPVSVADFN